MAEWRVYCPTRPCAHFDKCWTQKQQKWRWQKPETDIIQTRKCHVRGANHNRHKPVSVPTNKRGHHHEKNHEKSVGCNEYVVELVVPSKDLIPRLGKFHADQKRKAWAKDTCKGAKDQVHGSNVLMVGWKKPTLNEMSHTLVFLCVASSTLTPTPFWAMAFSSCEAPWSHASKPSWIERP